MLPANKLPNMRRRVQRARNFPTNTCPASRHLHLVADALAAKRPYPMLQEDPQHCAGTMYSVLESLWKARTALATLHRACLAMDAEREAERPTEAQYQAAMRGAARLLP